MDALVLDLGYTDGDARSCPATKARAVAAFRASAYARSFDVEASEWARCALAASVSVEDVQHDEATANQVS